MMKAIVAGITALSLTLATASPVQANGFDREDVGKLLLGLAAIAAVNAAIENRQRRDDNSDDVPVVTQSQNLRDNGWADLNRPRVRVETQRNALPYACLQTVDTRFGALRVFGDRCLDRNYRYAASLPARCEVRLYTDHGPVSGYDPLCLREQGYQTTRRH